MFVYRIGSALLTLSISVERYVAITKPFFAKKKMVKSCLIKFSIIFSICYNIPRWQEDFKGCIDLIFSDQGIPLWAVVNLNLNRTCPVCTGLPDNNVYWPDPIVQYVALTRITYDRGQFSWHSPVGGLTETTPMARSDFTVPNLGLFDRPHWLSPPSFRLYRSFSILKVFNSQNFPPIVSAA